MRQTKLSEYTDGGKPARVTRGNSDLPKEEPNPIESQSESEQQASSNPPKEKKIHHMTLKAIQRKRKLEQEAAALGITLQQKPQVPKIPKKRGRPKGYKVKKAQEKEEFEVKQPINAERQQTPQKKQIVLRKRDPAKKIVDEDSDALQRELQEMEMQIQQKQKEKEEEPPKPLELEIKVALPKIQVNAAAPAPKKRGRKKKVVTDLPIQSQASQPAQKLFTVPKSQTYDNYNKYYDKLMNVRNEENEHDPPLIFNKFMDPQGYEKLLRTLK